MKYKNIIIFMALLVREQVKTLLVEKNITMKELAELLSVKTGKNCSLANLSAKLTRGTLSYNEVVQVAEILGYEIKFTNKG